MKNNNIGPEKPLLNLPTLSPEAISALHSAEQKILSEITEKSSLNIVLIGATGVGAGHARQERYLEEHLKPAIQQTNSHLHQIDIPYQGEKQANTVIGNLYKFSQKIPAIQDLATKITNLAPKIPQGKEILVNIAKSLSRHDLLNKELSEAFSSGRIDPKIPTLFVCTYVGAAYSAQEFIKNLPSDEQSKFHIVELPPDPWEDGSLILMAMDKELPDDSQHTVIFHNQNSADSHQRAFGKETLRLPFGTASQKSFNQSEVETSNPANKGYLHISYETSGNPLPKNDQKIINFLSSNLEDINQGRLKFTLHCMNHQSTLDLFSKFIEKNSKKYPQIASNIQLMHQETLSQALTSRQDLIAGNSPFGKVDFALSKGGEVPLENRPYSIVGAIAGVGHEDNDVNVGVAEGRAVDLRKLPPNKWLKEIKYSLFSRPHKDYPHTNIPELGVIIALSNAVDMENTINTVRKIFAQTVETLKGSNKNSQLKDIEQLESLLESIILTLKTKQPSLEAETESSSIPALTPA